MKKRPLVRLLGVVFLHFSGLARRNFLIVYEEGITVFHDADHRLSSVQFNLISGIVIVSRCTIIGGLFPVYMNALAVCKKPAIPRGIMALEGKISLIVAHFVVSVFLSPGQRADRQRRLRAVGTSHRDRFRCCR